MTAIEGSRSPYAAATLEEAYAIWCDRIFPMHKSAGRIKRKPSFAAWCKTHTAKFKAFHTNHGAAAAGKARGKAAPDLLQQLAEALSALQAKEAEAEPEASDEYDEKREVPADAARNGVLWVLNSQGLMAEALERAEGDYITQDEGTSLLTERFGPLEKR